MAPVLKTGIPGRVSGVRIPHSPPDFISVRSVFLLLAIRAGMDSGPFKLDRRIIAGMNPGQLPGAAVSCVLIFLCLSHLPAGLAQSDPTVAQLAESFAHPPDDCRIMMRWWWFGPAVTKPEIQRELEQMKAAGIGGVEIATLYPQALGDLQTGFRNL